MPWPCSEWVAGVCFCFVWMSACFWTVNMCWVRYDSLNIQFSPTFESSLQWFWDHEAFDSSLKVSAAVCGDFASLFVWVCWKGLPYTKNQRMCSLGTALTEWASLIYWIIASHGHIWMPRLWKKYSYKQEVPWKAKYISVIFHIVFFFQTGWLNHCLYLDKELPLSFICHPLFITYGPRDGGLKTGWQLSGNHQELGEKVSIAQMFGKWFLLVAVEFANAWFTEA